MSRPRAEKSKTPDETPVRLAINVPAWMRRRLKIRAAETGESVNAYVVRLLKADGIKP